MHLSTLALALCDLVAPATCAGCGGPARLVCDLCLAALQRPPPARWLSARPGTAGLWVVSAASYSGVTRALLLAYKERGRPGLVRPLAAALVHAASAAGDPLPALAPSPRPAVPARRATGTTRGEGVLLVPVPSSSASVRRRGYDPVRRLAVRTTSGLAAAGVPAVCCPALRLARRVSDQAGLPAAARQANLAGAHTVARRFGRSVAGRAVVVVDDVVTTGATLVEAGRALRAAGAVPVGALTVGATPRRTGDAAA